MPNPHILPIILLLLLVPAARMPAAEDAEKTKQLVKILQSVGPEGAGQAEAAKAWKQLAGADAAELPAILAGIDGVNPLAANWLRTAADAIVERHLHYGGKLPEQGLERLVENRAYAPQTRRLAYELLVHSDPAASERWLPQMLDDPSLELRRDAVARLIDETAALTDPTKTAAGYRRALTSARDPDQIRLLTERLRKLGQEVDLPRHFGFVTRWKVIGPFDNADGKGFDATYPPEQKIDFAAEYDGKHGRVKWTDYATNDDYGQVDLNKAVVEEKNVAAYAAAEFFAARQQEVQFRMTSYNAVKLWLNGRVIDEHKVYHQGSQLDQYVSRGVLQPGRNVILVKVCQNDLQHEWARFWAFQLRVCDASGGAVLSSEAGKPRETRADVGQVANPPVLRQVARLLHGVPSFRQVGNLPHVATAALRFGLLCGADWRQFRGSDGNSVSDEKNLPAAFDAATGEHVAWKIALPGRGPSSPIVVAGRVFVTASSGVRQDRLHVLCFDAKSGKQLWQRQLWATGSTVNNPFGAVAANTPASDGQRVFAFFSSNDLACFDLDGNLQWLRGLGLEHPGARNDVGMASSPVVVGSTVVVQLENQGDSFAAGIDAATGKTRWKIDRERGGIWSSPVVLRSRSAHISPATSGRDGRAPATGDLVLLHGRSKITAHEPQSGKVVWEYAAPCSSISSSTTDGDCVYLPASGLQALKSDLAAGGIKRLWHDERLRSDNCSPVIHAGRVYVIKSPGILVCADAADGKTLWQLRLKGPFWATPVLAAGRLYCVNHDGLVQVVELGAEGKLAGSGQIDAGILASPAVADGAIYFRSDAHLWKIVP